MVEKFTWNNGTESNPVPLTIAMMEKLIAAGNDSAIETSVKGYYIEESNMSVPRSIVWGLQTLFPDLHFMGTIVEDRFSISTNFSTFNEGGYVTVNAEGINVNYLQFACVFEDITIDPADIALIDAATIRSRFRFEGNTLYVDPPQENTTWSASIRIKACPLYEDIETTSNYRLTGQDMDGEWIAPGAGIILTNAIKMTGVVISASDRMSVNSMTYISKSPTPATSTKLSQATYTYAVSPATAGNFNGDYFRSGSTAGNVNITATPYLFGSTLPISNAITIEIYESLATTIRIDQTISDPYSMILNPQDCGVNNIGNPNNVINWIRQNSHCYLCKFHDDNRGMEIKQLWDGDRRYFDNDGAQGAAAVIDGTPDTYGLISDVFMRMPEFYYKTVNEVDENQEETGIVSISFATGALDESYIRWDPNTLIGAYRGHIIANSGGVVGKLYSISGANPGPPRPSKNNVKTSARNRNGSNSATVNWHFFITDYQTHCVMALLYYCYYGNTNCQQQIGSGTNSVRKTTGATNGRGMSDTNAGIDGNTGSINFWGLENWWGDGFEVLDNLTSYTWTYNVGANFRLYDYNNNYIRQIGTNLPVGSAGGATKCQRITSYVFGPYADMIPKTGVGNRVTDTTYTTDFCDGIYTFGSNGGIVYRGGANNYAIGGVGYLHNPSMSASDETWNICARLMYNGKVTVVDEL